MNSLVVFQITGGRVLAGVHALVDVQVGKLSKPLIAYVTLVRLLTGVGELLPYEMGLLGERFLACFAFE